MSGILERIETKLDTVIELLSDGKPTLADVTQQPTSLLEQAVADATTETGADPYAGVDADGVRWDKRIHSKAKEPIAATTGKWKRKKGITDKLYEDVMAELKAAEEEEEHADLIESQGPFFWMDTVTNVSNTCETRAEMDELLEIPTTKELTEAEFDALLAQDVPSAPPAPKAPGAPQAPAAPTAPQAPAAPGVSSVKGEVLQLIKVLTDTHKVEPNDVNQLMAETTEFDTINKVPEDKLPAFKEELEAWKAAIEECNTAFEVMKGIAAPLNFTESLNDGVAGILEPHDADCVGLVHYSSISGVKDQFEAYLKTWQEL